jgi:hypothetical protein
MAVRRFPSVATAAIALAFLLTWAGGCQTAATVSSRRLIEHQAMIDFSGLKPETQVADVKASIGTPQNWEQLPPKLTALFSHEQWRGPSTHTGVGILYAHLPFPLSPSTVIWFAEQEYSRKQSGGKVIGQWVDPLGRSWFEAENDKYHVRGYVVTQGFSAWIVYFGYRTKYPPDLAEISQAARSAETAVPVIDDVVAPATQPVVPSE